MRRLVLLSAVPLFLGLALACQEQATVTDVDLVPSFAVQKVEVCHNMGNGTFQIITIADPGLPAHIEHGDAEPGGDVPGMPGYVFDELCEPVLAAACPCFDDAALDAIDWASEDCTEFKNFPGINVWLYSYEDTYHSLTQYAYSFGYRAGNVNFPSCSLRGNAQIYGLTDDETSACNEVVTRKAVELGFPNLTGTNYHLDASGVSAGTCF